MTSGCMCLTVKILGLWHDPKQIAQKKKNDAINEKAEAINISASQSTKRMLEFTLEKGTSLIWLTVISISEMGFNLNKQEFRDALKLRYHWPLSDNASKCVWRESFNLVIVIWWEPFYGEIIQRYVDEGVSLFNHTTNYEISKLNFWTLFVMMCRSNLCYKKLMEKP